MFRKVPLIVVLGSTGTGKTKLSIQLAERYGGEIISADSMQVYANLDVATAKATKEEQSKVRHHLLDVAQPFEPFTVHHFRNMALPIVNNLLEQSKCPIVVGGTNYYIESLLWDVLVDTKSTATNQNSTGSDNIYNEDSQYQKISSETLHHELLQIDPITANRIHPNNKRKIIRALEVYKQTGVPLSTFLSEQRNQIGGNRLGGPLRYPHTILIWLRCNQDILNQRLDNRVDSMLELGLLKELREFYDRNMPNKELRSDDEYTKGILQTIGFKEFIPYLKEFDATEDQLIVDFLKESAFMFPVETNANQPAGLSILNKCLNELKMVTQRYSKRQIKWIRNRFLSSQGRQLPPLYTLDTTDVAKWNENIESIAFDIIDSYIQEKVSQISQTELIPNPNADLNEEITNFCDICKRHFVGEFQWRSHLKSMKHKKRKDGINRKLKNANDS